VQSHERMAGEGIDALEDKSRDRLVLLETGTQ
jgi:hypothetical protein